jgi:hypothetical protein
MLRRQFQRSVLRRLSGSGSGSATVTGGSGSGNDYYTGPYYTQPSISEDPAWTNPQTELYKGHYNPDHSKPVIDTTLFFFFVTLLALLRHFWQSQEMKKINTMPLPLFVFLSLSLDFFFSFDCLFFDLGGFFFLNFEGFERNLFVFFFVDDFFLLFLARK